MKSKKETKQEELLRILSMPREQRPGVKYRFIEPIGSEVATLNRTHTLK
jgi:hypothetical protein